VDALEEFDRRERRTSRRLTPVRSSYAALLSEDLIEYLPLRSEAFFKRSASLLTLLSRRWKRSCLMVEAEDGSEEEEEDEVEEEF